MMDRGPSSLHRRAGRTILLALALASATGCINLRPPMKNPPVWPLPPDKPRVRFVKAFASEDDLRTGFGMFFKRVFSPADPMARALQPTGVSLSADEKRLIVACAPTARILEFHLETGVVRLLANREGRRPTQPFAAVLDGEDRLYVTDSAQRFVWVFDRDGKAVLEIGRGVLTRPTGLAIDRRRQLLYVVNGGTAKDEHHAVEVFSLKGQHLRRIGKRGSGPGEFFFPAHVAVAKDGTVYVSDVFNSRVEAFAPEGELIGMVGESGVGAPGLFQKLKGVAVDSFGNVHAVDSATAIVQMFNPKLRPLMAYGGFDRGGQKGLELPGGIVIDSKNNIYVAEYATSRILQFQLFNTEAREVYEKSVVPASAGAPPKK